MMHQVGAGSDCFFLFMNDIYARASASALRTVSS